MGRVLTEPGAKGRSPAREPTLDEIQGARTRIAGVAIRTPLIRFQVDGVPGEIYLKLENLQPVGSFKIRGAANALGMASREELQNGVWTASAGNMAQGLAWMAHRLGIKCTAVVPAHAPDAKLSAIARLGAQIEKVPFDRWWEIIVAPGSIGMPGMFVHPVSDPAVIAGNGTIGLELLEDLPDLDAVVIPYGGGGLITGIASGLRSLKPNVRVYGAEVETAAPLWTALQAGAPREARYTPSFVDGIGARTVLDEMWPVVRRLVNSSIVVSLAEIAAAIRLLVERNRIVAEGAGAASAAAALTGHAGPGRIACVISGGNIDPANLLKIFSGQVP
jgi:threonine dehydratase